MSTQQDKIELLRDIAILARRQSTRASAAGFHSLAAILDMAHIEASWVEAMMTDPDGYGGSELSGFMSGNSELDPRTSRSVSEDG